MAPEQHIILVDGSSFLFRAYHAIREPLTTSKGQTTHAILGAINMLRNVARGSLTDGVPPQYLAVVMDAKGKTFRHRMYPQYKAQRPPMPDDLRAQLGYVNEVIPALGLKLVAQPGVEADDVIGVLAQQASARGLQVVVASSDKDLAQLVGPRVVMVDTMKNVRLDSDGVRAKFGVPPEKIVDLLGLMGDASDNIPGVPKVGPKTAVKWLDEFGSVEQIIARADEIGGKVGESLRAHIEQLELSKRLATLKLDLELGIELNDMRLAPPDVDKLRALYQELEFNSLLKQLDAAGDESGDNSGGQSATKSATDAEISPQYQTILDQPTLTHWLNKLRAAELFAIDTETTSLDPQRAELVGISFAITPHEAAYLPLRHSYAGAPTQLPFDDAMAQLRPILEDENQPKTGQNLKYDLAVLARCGIDLRGISHDTMLMSYLLDAGHFRHDLDTLARKHLGRGTISFAQVAGHGKNQLTFDQVPVVAATDYAAEDADLTLQIHHVLSPRLEKNPAPAALFRDLEMPLIEVLARIERHGVRIDVDMLRQLSTSIATRLTRLEAEAHAAAGERFNIASPKQIQLILYHKLGLTVSRKTPKGQPSTAENVLQELARQHELPRLILEHRSLAKLKGGYTDTLPALVNPRTGRIHTSYHQAVAATGRLSSSDPNLQNIPIRSADGRRIREAFIAAPGYLLVAADYSQIELRIMAHLSADAGLITAFEHGLDVHAATAAEVFGIAAEAVDEEQRRRAKAINFGLIYGMSAYGLARQLNLEQKQARQYIEIYFDRYPGVKRYMEDTKSRAREHGYVETLYGRRLNLPEIHSKNTARRHYAERTAINAPMQGSAADLIKLAMLAVDRWIMDSGSSAKIIMQVHDELVLEVAAAQAEQVAKHTAELMCKVATLKVPLVADTGIGHNWKEAH